MSDKLSVHQEKRWSFAYYFKEYKEGWTILLQVYFDGVRAIFRGRSQERSTSGTLSEVTRMSSDSGARNSAELWGVETEKDGESDESVSIGYGIIILSKMLVCTSLYMPAFVLDAKPGLSPSKQFIRNTYILITFCLFLGFYCTENLVRPILIETLPSLIRRVTSLLTNVATLSQNLVLLLGLGSLMATLHMRQALQDFVLYQSNIISLPKSYQRRKAVQLFVTHYLLTLFSKPAFVTLMAVFDAKQPRQLQHLSASTFLLARWLLIALIAFGSTIVCFSGVIIPLLTTYLIACSTSHLNRLLQKHISHFSRIDRIGLCRWRSASSRQNEQLEALLDAHTRRMIDDYSCDTLTCDWPHFITSVESEREPAEPSAKVSEEQSTSPPSKLTNFIDEICGRISLYLEPSSEPAVSQFCASGGSKTSSLKGQPKKCVQVITPMKYRKSVAAIDELSCVAKHNSNLLCSESSANSINHSDLGAQYTSTSNGLLFIYKNLIKSLSELKGMIGVYERKFGTFHLMQICIDSLIVAQWITSSLTESRLKEELKSQRVANGSLARALNQSDLNGSLEANQDRLSSLVWLSSMGVLSFVLANSYIFMLCDCLPNCMVKMRSKLFKMNIDSARCALEPNQCHMEATTGWEQNVAQSSNLLTLGKQNDFGSQSSSYGLQKGVRRKLSDLRLQSSQSRFVPMDECVELDQVWSLYDQLVRMSELANFRLTAGTYYSKRCLLWIFGRAVSLTLLCIQIVDIYSYA